MRLEGRGQRTDVVNLDFVEGGCRATGRHGLRGEAEALCGGGAAR